MAESRWRNPGIPPREAVLLLPNLPNRAEVLARKGEWSPALESWGVAVERVPVPKPGGAPLVVGTARAGAARGAAMVLVNGRDRAGHLKRAGYAVQTYTAHRAPAGAIVIEPINGRRRRRIRALSGGSPLRRLLIVGVRSATGRRYVTVAHRGGTTPLVVRAAAGWDSTPLALLAGGGGPRRRSAFLVGDPSSPRPHTVVKVGPARGRSRGTKEQQVLRRIHACGLGSAVPRPQGEGTVGDIHWSAESAAPGRPLSDSLVGTGRRPETRETLEQITKWFTCLAVATRTPRTSTAAANALPIRGEHRRLLDLRAAMEGVPGVLVHGDVGTGFNILLDRASFTVIDWETAVEGELPLTDVLPLVCNALAATWGHYRPRDAANYIVRLCAGREADSGWLLTMVRNYCQALQVPLDKAGTLAALTWGYQASMRLVHEELIVEAGGVVPAWESSADFVARAWLQQADLGLTWRALTASTT